MKLVHSTGHAASPPSKSSRHFGTLKILRSSWQKLCKCGRGSHLYQAFRPTIPAGVAGWGKKGVLDLGKLRNSQPRKSDDVRYAALAAPADDLKTFDAWMPTNHVISS